MYNNLFLGLLFLLILSHNNLGLFDGLNLSNVGVLTDYRRKVRFSIENRAFFVLFWQFLFLLGTVWNIWNKFFAIFSLFRPHP